MANKLRIGVDIGGTNIELAALHSDVQNTDDVIFAHESYPVGVSCEELCLFLKKAVLAMLNTNGLCMDDVEAIGIAIPGEVDAQNGVVVHAYNLGLHNAKILACAAIQFPGVLIHVANDADAAALGEHRLGALAGKSSGCLVTLGTGVGAGIIIDNKLYRGGRMRGTELGHMVLDINGKRCSCNQRGCIETMCSASAIAAAAKEYFADDITAKQIFELAKDGNAVARRIFNRYVDCLAAALASYINLLDPEIIAIGGGVSLSGEFLLAPLRKKTEEISFFHPICDIVVSTLGDKAGVIGAALL